MTRTKPKTILYYDGVCVLCNWFIQYIYKRDKEGNIFFSQLQSDFAEKELHIFGLEPKKLESLVLVHDNSVYVKAKGALKIVRILPVGIHKILLIGIILPSFITNGIYQLIASIRYRLFGKKEQCELPSGDIKQRYIY